MEKKLTSVGIITMHKSDNYGAVLQSYALVKAIEKVGAKAEIINYIPERFKTSVQFFYVHPRRYNSILKKYIIMAASLPIRALIYYRYNTFLKEYLPVGKNVYYSEEDLETRIPKYDVYMSGSDQVWNPEFEGRIDSAFFLKFAPDTARKVAYAVSFGKGSLSDIEAAEVKKLLSRYDYISVREKSGKEIITNLGFDAEYLLDPTFLLDGNEWRTFSNKRLVKEKYVLVYQLNPNPKLLEIANRIAKEHNLKVVKFSRDVVKKAGVDINMAFQRPEYFVSMIANADYIVTDSFHGTAFSINLHKKFTVVMPPKYSDRLNSILTKLELESRLADEMYDIEPDYIAVEQILKAERKKSIMFLEKCISGDKE